MRNILTLLIVSLSALSSACAFQSKPPVVLPPQPIPIEAWELEPLSKPMPSYMMQILRALSALPSEPSETLSSAE